jgi:tetratricopeptide (TPR) repeat protein
MKTGILLFLLALLSGWKGLSVIHDRNQAVQKAQAAYERRDYLVAATYYKEAVEKLGATDEAVLLNWGHASVRANQLASARGAYGRLLASRQPQLRTVAHQQLGVLAASKGDYAQALRLLKQALIDNPANAVARYNYELISDYLRRRRDDPGIPPPATAGAPPTTESKPESRQDPASQPPPRPGQDKQDQLDDSNQPNDPRNRPQSRPDQNGQQDPNQPSGTPGNTANGGLRPGEGTERNMARGSEPGSTLGLSDSEIGADAPSGTSNRLGTDAATLTETQLQTQRARLQQMNLSTGQAKQLLQALDAAEQQYLQQLPRKSTRKPSSNKPTW